MFGQKKKKTQRRAPSEEIGFDNLAVKKQKVRDAEELEFISFVDSIIPYGQTAPRRIHLLARRGPLTKDSDGGKVGYRKRKRT